MYDTKLDKAGVIAWALWVAVAALTIAAIASMLADHWRISVMLGLGAGVLSPAAGAAQIRWYCISVTAVVRRQVNSDPRPAPEPLHPVRT